MRRKLQPTWSLMIQLLLFVLVVFSCVGHACSGEVEEKLVLATYKLANDTSTATGIVVHRDSGGVLQRYVITSNHVLAQMKGDNCFLVSRKRQDSGEYFRDEIQIPIRDAGKDKWISDSENDVAVLRLPDGINVVSLPLDCLATEESLQKVFTGDAVRSASFPERTEANGAGFPLMRVGIIASHPIRPTTNHRTFSVDCNAWKGDSGSAVMHGTLRYRNDWPMILGITRSMQSVTDTVNESRFVQRRTDYPLGFAIVVHASFARRLIENN